MTFPTAPAILSFDQAASPGQSVITMVRGDFDEAQNSRLSD
jgi:hypothetical protein